MKNRTVILYPLANEKAVRLIESENKLIFMVERTADKKDIKKAVQTSFNVKVKKVNTLITPAGKKKAYVTLSKDTPALDVATQLGMM